jgi:hypothetical protein
MADENTSVEPEDDAVVVQDEVGNDEKAHEELVGKVATMLNRDEWGDERTEDETPVSDSADEKPSAKDEKPALDKEVLARAEAAGLNKDLAKALSQSGQLEETLAAFDRKLVERIQSDTTEKQSNQREDSPPEQTEEDHSDIPELDPDVYDEEIIKRDKFHKDRIDRLESQLNELIQEKQAAFDDWFDGTLQDLGYDLADEDKCQKTFKAYEGICKAMGVAPEKQDAAMVQRAHAAMFPEEANKQSQKQTVKRLKDAEGKFLSSSKPKGEPPARERTDEEVHGELVSNVKAYLKKQGVEMSGY